MYQAPHHKRPIGSMPNTTDQEGHNDIKVRANFTTSASPKGIYT